MSQHNINEKDPAQLEKGGSHSSLEKPQDGHAHLGQTTGTHPAGPNAFVADDSDDRYHFDSRDLDKVQRRLKQRHVQMIAIGECRTGVLHLLRWR
jgi:amino acid permease